MAYLCLNASRWAEINAFVEDTGMQLVLGLSLNATQNDILLRHSRRQNFSRILAYEIPEEFTPGWHNYPGSDGTWAGYKEKFDCPWECYIEMYHTLASTLKELYGADAAASSISAYCTLNCHFFLQFCIEIQIL